MSNHLGNVLVTVSDKKFGHVNGSSYDYYNADVVSAHDFYLWDDHAPIEAIPLQIATGMGLMETKMIMKGEGNEQDYGMRVYDPRVGRFLSVDPLEKTYSWK